MTNPGLPTRPRRRGPSPRHLKLLLAVLLAIARALLPETTSQPPKPVMGERRGR